MRCGPKGLTSDQQAISALCCRMETDFRIEFRLILAKFRFASVARAISANRIILIGDLEAGMIEMDAMTNHSENYASESDFRDGEDPKCLPRRPDNAQVQIIVAQHKILARQRLAKALITRRKR